MVLNNSHGVFLCLFCFLNLLFSFWALLSLVFSFFHLSRTSLPYFDPLSCPCSSLSAHLWCLIQVIWWTICGCFQWLSLYLSSLSWFSLAMLSFLSLFSLFSVSQFLDIFCFFPQLSTFVSDVLEKSSFNSGCVQIFSLWYFFMLSVHPFILLFPLCWPKTRKSILNMFPTICFLKQYMLSHI